nr:hypothetical protein BaRGS_019598 [Batillaria attramentaria]
MECGDGPENDTEVLGPSPFITFNGTQMMTLTCHATVNPAVDYDWLGVESLPRPVSEEFEGRHRNAPLSMTKMGIQIDLRAIARLTGVWDPGPPWK